MNILRDLYTVKGLWYYVCPRPKCKFTTVSNLTSRADAIGARANHEREHDN